MDFSHHLRVRISDDMYKLIKEAMAKEPDRFLNDSDFVRISIFIMAKSIIGGVSTKNGKLL